MMLAPVSTIKCYKLLLHRLKYAGTKKHIMTCLQAAAEQAGVLLEGMQFFTLPDKLLTHQRAQSLTGILISLVGLTTQLGPAFAR